jgi:glutamyl-tRNA reductase
MELGIIGTSIWQQNLPLMERLTLSRETKQVDLEQIKQALGLDELVYLSTCNRVEFMYVTSGKLTNGRLFHRLLDHFFHGKKDISFFPNDFYHVTGKEAMTHLFRTAASLESLVVGETQITGQIKQALQEAEESGLCGPSLSGLISEALLVAKKVKRDTSIGLGALSMASLACNELRDHLIGVDTPVIALVGAGPMTRKLASHIKDNKIGTVLFVNRTMDRAAELAAEFDGSAISLDTFIQNPNKVDAIISATAATEPVFDLNFVARLPKTEKQDRKSTRLNSSHDV